MSRYVSCIYFYNDIFAFCWIFLFLLDTKNKGNRVWSERDERSVSLFGPLGSQLLLCREVKGVGEEEPRTDRQTREPRAGWMAAMEIFLSLSLSFDLAWPRFSHFILQPLVSSWPILHLQEPSTSAHVIYRHGINNKKKFSFFLQILMSRFFRTKNT